MADWMRDMFNSEVQRRQERASPLFQAGLAGVMEDLKNWRGVQQWEADKAIDQGFDEARQGGEFAFSDPVGAREAYDFWGGVGPGDVGNGSAVAGMIKPTVYELAHEVARKNAVDMLGLPENNTSIDRALALGFDTNSVHWSRHGVDVNELDSGRFAIAPFDAVGTHTGTEDAAMAHFTNWRSPMRPGGVTYPVAIKAKNPLFDPTGKPWKEEDLNQFLRKSGGHDDAMSTDKYRELNASLRETLFKDNDVIPYINDVESAGSISYISPPQNIRSRFAAFDPARTHESDLLASNLLPLLTGSMFGYSLLNSDNAMAGYEK